MTRLALLVRLVGGSGDVADVGEDFPDDATDDWETIERMSLLRGSVRLGEALVMLQKLAGTSLMTPVIQWRARGLGSICQGGRL